MPEETEVIQNLTPQQLQDALEPKPVIVGNEDEIEAIKNVFDTNILSDEEPEAETKSNEPAATAETPAIPETVEVDGKQVSFKDLLDAHRNKTAWRRANDERASENARRKAELDAAEARILAAIASGQPKPEPPAPEPVKVDMSGLGARPVVPDLSTLEGQEKYAAYQKELAAWEDKRLELAIQAAAKAGRDEALKEVDVKLKAFPEATTQVVRRVLTAEQQEAENRRILEYNKNLREDFINRSESFGLTPLQAEVACNNLAARVPSLNDIEPSGENTAAGKLFTTDDLLKAARKIMNTNHAANNAANNAVRTTLETVKRGQEASNVLKSGKTPSGGTLKISDVLSMSVEDLRKKVVGPMKGRKGPEAHGLDPLFKTWKAIEEISA